MHLKSVMNKLIPLTVMGFVLCLFTASADAKHIELSNKTDARYPVVIPSAYRDAAAMKGIPPAILFSVALGESGTLLQRGDILPWPWTLNINGQGYFYRTREAAYIALKNAIDKKQTVDIGLGQVNWQSHHARLANDAWLALEPEFNLQLAASILREHFLSSKHWWIAVGRYHSPGQKPAQILRASRYASGIKKRYVAMGYIDPKENHKKDKTNIRRMRGSS